MMSNREELNRLFSWRRNTSWWKFDNSKYGVCLTSAAPPKAQKSFQEWVEYIDKVYPNVTPEEPAFMIE